MIPEYSWRLYEGLLRLLATQSDAAAAAAEFERCHPGKGVERMLGFLRDIGFVRADSVRLTEAGGHYAAAKFARNDPEDALAVLRHRLHSHAETVALCQTLYGRPNLTIENVGFALASSFPHGSDTQALTPLLDLLNTTRIATYSRKHRSIRIQWQPDAEESPPPASFITPQTPYSNIRRLREVLGSLRGNVFWIDKHFDKKAFDAVCNVADGAKWRSLTIISGGANATQSAQADYARLKREMSGRGIRLEWRLVDRSFEPQFHDRWLLGDNACYNVPPVNSIYKGQEAQILMTQDGPDASQYLANSSPLSTVGGRDDA